MKFEKLASELAISKDSACFVNGFKGLEYCKKEDFVNKEFMKKKGFNYIIEAEGKLQKDGKRNKSTYFIRPRIPYIYVECYLANLERYCKLIISKKLYYMNKMEHRAITLTPDKGAKKNRCTPSLRLTTGRFDLHKLFGIVGEVDHITGSYNLIIEENLRGVRPSQNCKNKEQPYVARNTNTGEFIVKVVIKESITDVDKKDLEDRGYDVIDTGYVNIYQEFKNEVEAIKGLRMLEERFYKEFAYTPINDMRGRFNLKFQQLILGTMTQDDVIKTVLKDYAMYAFSVHRYNLIPLCEKYGIPYNDGGEPAPNGDLVNR